MSAFSQSRYSVNNRLVNIYNQDLLLDSHVYEPLQKGHHCPSVFFDSYWLVYLHVACKMTGIEGTPGALTVISFKTGVDNICLFKHTKPKFQSSCSCTVYNNRAPIQKQNMKIFLFV